MADNAGAPIASVLIVDDSPVQRAHAVSVCRALGVGIVHTAGNGSEALALLSQLAVPPELLILDLEMPTMDGSQFLQRLHQQGIDIQVLICSSREITLLDLVSDMGSVLGLRVAALQKPLSPEGLRRELTKSASVPKQQSVERMNPTAADLGLALERGEICCHYQPKVDMRTAIVRGVEVLARWRHPTLGMVSPAEFIPLAERSGAILDLTLRIVQDAMSQSAAWMAHGLHLSVALNLSPSLLDRASLPDEILMLQESHALPPDKIVFELTESSLVSGTGVALGVMARMRLKGFGLSIDDYGTGFSQMQQLTRIPFTELKIDRSFVHQSHERENRRVILRSALEMADRLGVTSVAEGVETMEDWRLLQDLGCAVAQGYLIAHPMPGAELRDWLKAYRRRMPGLAAMPRAAGMPAGGAAHGQARQRTGMSG
jgi:EAL domain-containing protein (putative c-di-GMP-specific phosphodiesterase class I)/AmiR/NasT family two-component response regulator